MLMLDMTSGCFIGGEKEPIVQEPAMSSQSGWALEQPALQLVEFESEVSRKPSVGVLGDGMGIRKFGFGD